jgi:hypothetical protein
MSRIDILVLYINFYGFEKYRVSAQNLNWLAFSFTEKYLSRTKIGRKSVFHPHEVHILCRLDVSILYINFYGF